MRPATDILPTETRPDTKAPAGRMNESIRTLRDQIARVYLGDPRAIDRLLCCLLARGHALLEDVPGVGKTVLASSLARSIDTPFTRVQLTPDMLPSDLIGVTIFDRDGHELRFQKGPIFTGILLADEINRTTPRTQSALLEAMSDGSVSVDGRTYTLPRPFMVVATQNPIGFEGTYPLPENQLDRFLMRITLGYPTAEAEARLLDLRPAATVLDTLAGTLTGEVIVQMQESVDRVVISEPVRRYIVDIARATRQSELFAVGLSPRGSLALAQACRAWAWMQSRDHVVPDDVLELLSPVGAHRTVPSDPRVQSNHDQSAELLRDVTRSVAAPA